MFAWLVGAVLLATVGCGDEDPAAPAATTASTTTTAVSTTTESTARTTTVPLEPSGGSVSTPVPAPESDAAITEELVAETSSADVYFDQLRINGVDYPSALIMEPAFANNDEIQVQLDAGRRRKRFLGELGIPDKDPSQTVYRVDISFDTAAPILSTEVRFGETVPLNLDVTNVLRIKFTAYRLSECCGGSVAIGSPRFALDE